MERRLRSRLETVTISAWLCCAAFAGAGCEGTVYLPLEDTVGAEESDRGGPLGGAPSGPAAGVGQDASPSIPQLPEPGPPSNPANPDPVDPGANGPGNGGNPGNPGPTPVEKVLAYLRGLSGKQTVSGQHNREPSSEPARWSEAIRNTTGRSPGLWSGDFLFEQESIDARGTLVEEAKRRFSAGSLVQFLYHACPPTQGEACGWEGGVKSHLSDEQWKELLTAGSRLNSVWKSRLDRIAVHLQALEDASVAVLFRPIHEMNQGAFWWGGRPGPEGTGRLYQITHDYLTKDLGLTNLIWIWDVQDLSWDFAAYNPGEGYFDIAALDMYGDGYTQEKYKAMLEVAGDKLIAIGECEKLPTPDELAAQPRWVFFMAWAELVYEGNTEQQIKTLYASDRVVNLDEMPGWSF